MIDWVAVLAVGLADLEDQWVEVRTDWEDLLGSLGQVVDRSSQVEEVRRGACSENRGQGHIGLVVDQTRDHIVVVVGSSPQTVVEEDSLEVGREIDRDVMEDLAVKEVVQVERNSGETRLSVLSTAK